MEALKLIPYVLLVICISAVVGGACAITLGNFGDTVDQCWNSTYSYHTSLDACNGTTANDSSDSKSPGRNFSQEYYTIWQGNQANSDVLEQLPTVAIIGVMVIIIALISGVFVYMRYFA